MRAQLEARTARRGKEATRLSAGWRSKTEIAKRVHGILDAFVDVDVWRRRRRGQEASEGVEQQVARGLSLGISTSKKATRPKAKRESQAETSLPDSDTRPPSPRRIGSSSRTRHNTASLTEHRDPIKLFLPRAHRVPLNVELETACASRDGRREEVRLARGAGTDG